MTRRLAPAALACVAGILYLAGCAGDANTRALNALAAACDGYALALGQAAMHKAKLSPEQIARIDGANAVVDPVCLEGSTFDPREGVAVVERAIAVVNSVKEAIR